MRLLEEIRNDANGAALLADWLGAGAQPVHRQLAEVRAFACSSGDTGNPDGSRCRFNVAPRWWETVKGQIADTIRSEMEIKFHLQLKVSREEGINMCKLCGCCLRLKVWAPIEHIAAHTSPELRDKLPKWCWMKKELNKL